MTAEPVGRARSNDLRPVLEGRLSSMVISTDRLRGTMTYLLPSGGDADRPDEPLLARVAATADAEVIVEREARMLVELRRRRLGPIEVTLPRHVGTRQLEGRLVTLSSTLPGARMDAGHPRRLPVVSPRRVQRDFDAAYAWLRRLHRVSAGIAVRLDWGEEIQAQLLARWGGHPALPSAARQTELARERVGHLVVPRTVVHGDLGPANLLLDPARGHVSGVLDWSEGEPEGCPLRDVVRFALRYSDLTPHALRVARSPAGATQAPDLLRRGWHARTVQAHLQQAMADLGLESHGWKDVLLLGAADLAACSRDPESAERFLRLLGDGTRSGGASTPSPAHGLSKSATALIRSA